MAMNALLNYPGAKWGMAEEPEHIARISMGKDSIKMLHVIITRGLPLDRVTTTDVWATDTLRAELPEVLEAKERIEEKLWQMYRINVEHLCARNKDGTKRTYEQMFYHIPNRRSQSVQVERERETGSGPDRSEDSRIYGTNGASQISNGTPAYRVQGSITGFPPNTRYNWCQKLKIVQDCNQGMADGERKRPMVPATQGSSKTPLFPLPCHEGQGNGKRKIVEYIGIAADEPDRFGQLSEWKRAPLVEFDIEESLCGLHCQYNDMLLPSYDTGCRDGCWFCHNQGIDQLRNLWRNYPDHWALLMKWDLDSPVTFKADGHTVHDFDRRFQMEVERKIPMDRTFRWAMLDKPPAFVPDRGEQISIPGF